MMFLVRSEVHRDTVHPRRPRGTSRDDVIFSGERYFRRESSFQEPKSPWELFLTKRVPEVVEILFWPIKEEVFPGNSVALSYELVFFTDWSSCLACTTGRFSWRVLEKKIFKKFGKSQTVACREHKLKLTCYFSSIVAQFLKLSGFRVEGASRSGKRHKRGPNRDKKKFKQQNDV